MTEIVPPGIRRVLCNIVSHDLVNLLRAKFVCLTHFAKRKAYKKYPALR